MDVSAIGGPAILGSLTGYQDPWLCVLNLAAGVPFRGHSLINPIAVGSATRKGREVQVGFVLGSGSLSTIGK